MSDANNQATAAFAPDPLATLLEELLRDQEARWAKGDRVGVEDLLQAHPELRAQADPVLELIYQEAILREEQGEVPILKEYQERFPELADMLRIQWEVDQILASRRSRRSQGSAERKPATTTARRVGRYELQGVLGKGGMGIAYRAWDPQLKRVVALKMLRANDDTSADDLARFAAEAEAIARVRHPHIVEVFDVGAEAGQPFFAMEYCAGGSLKGKLSGKPIPPREAAHLVEQIAQGVAAAHAEKIIHRDLKPGNVLLTLPEGEPAGPLDKSATSGKSSSRFRSKTLADKSTTGSSKKHGSTTICKVTDFGLAKILDSDDGRTRTGAIMGTPSYMAPEQAFGHTKRIGAAVDIYALGAVLYECLTGRPPFQGATVADTLDQVRNADPVAVRRLQPNTPRDLETIAMKCLRKEPAHRYASAQELAEELDRFLQGRPIHARPVSILERSWRWCRRNPVVALLLFVCAGAGIALLVGWASFTAQLSVEKNIAQSSAKNALEKTKLARASEQNLLDTLEKLVTRFTNKKLDGVAGMEELRKEWANLVIPAFERQLQSQDDPDPSVRREAGLAYQRAAKIHQALGQQQKRGEHLQAALKVQRALVKDFPNDVNFRADLAGTLHNLDLMEEALTIRAELAKERPTDVETLNNLGRTCSGLAIQHRAQGHPAKGLAALQSAIAAHESSLKLKPDDEESLRDLGRAQGNLGVQLYYQSRPSDDAFLASLTTLEGLAKLVNDRADIQEEIANVCTKLAGVYAFYGDGAKGLEFADRALKINEELARKYRGLPSYRQRLADSFTFRGTSLFSLKRYPEADIVFEKSYKIHHELTHEFDDVSRYRTGLGKICCIYAASKTNQKDFKAAKTYLEECLTLLKPIRDLDIVTSTTYARGLVQMGQRHQTDPKSAHAYFEEAVQILNHVLSRSKANPEATVLLNQAREGLAGK